MGVSDILVRQLEFGVDLETNCFAIPPVVGEFGNKWMVSRPSAGKFQYRNTLKFMFRGREITLRLWDTGGK